MPTFNDKSGAPLMPGDYIVYGYNLGRCASLRYGKVLGMKETKNPAQYERATKTKLKIRGCDFYKGQEAFVSQNGSEYKAYEPKANLLYSASWLEFGDRVLCIHPDQMPPEVLAELAPIEVDKN